MLRGPVDFNQRREQCWHLYKDAIYDQKHYNDKVVMRGSWGQKFIISGVL
jgi:hypothetical protein